MRLMISVVSALEAREAIAAGSELLDIKNPEEGSLGAQPPRVIREIRAVCPARIQVSAAIGDMPNLPGTAALAALGAALCGVEYIKAGLHGSRSEGEALELLSKLQDAVRDFSVSIIAAAYADCGRVGTLSPMSLPRLAASAGIRGCLIDTAIKDDHRLFDFLNPEAIRSIAREAHARGLLFGAAGSLHAEDLPRLMDCEVDVAGVRTAVCRDGRRNGPLDGGRVRNLIEKFK